MNATMTRPAVTNEARYERHAMARVTDALRREFAGRLTAELVELAVAETYERFSKATIREFVPVMVERTTRARLVAMVGVQPVPSGGAPQGT